MEMWNIFCEVRIVEFNIIFLSSTLYWINTCNFEEDAFVSALIHFRMLSSSSSSVSRMLIFRLSLHCQRIPKLSIRPIRCVTVPVVINVLPRRISIFESISVSRPPWLCYIRFTSTSRVFYFSFILRRDLFLPFSTLIQGNKYGRTIQQTGNFSVLRQFMCWNLVIYRSGGWGWPFDVVWKWRGLAKSWLM
jgi:hypothetical protein